MAFLCVDIGGTNTLIGVGNGEFEIVKKVKSKQFLEDIGKCLEDALTPEKINEIDMVAVAAAGPIDKDKGTFRPPNIDMNEVSITAPLETFGRVEIVNDCAAGVLGEHHYGNHDTDNLIYITISSGIGAGAVFQGELIEAEHGNFGEVGHMKMNEFGMKCGCGLEDHWEAYCSGNSLPGLAREVAGEEFDSAVEIFERYKEGDEAAGKTIEKMQEINLNAVSDIVNMYNPGKIVLGGAVALNHPGTVADHLNENIHRHVTNEPPEVQICDLGEEAVLHGLRAVCNGE